MKTDLTVARWLKLMADDPTQDPKLVRDHAKAYWNDPRQGNVVTALVQHQGSLHYSDPTTLTFEYLVPLPSIGQVATKCSHPVEEPAKKTASKKRTSEKPAKSSWRLPRTKCGAIPTNIPLVPKISIMI
ncbi:MAG: hypothetical protein CMJ78_10780 [Planctomycetaceae bacterium]|nr:hypothetical protein [Planctomycetaceae bacterium]